MTARTLHRVTERLEARLAQLEKGMPCGALDPLWGEYLATAAAYAAVLAQLTPSRRAELVLHALES